MTEATDANSVARERDANHNAPMVAPNPMADVKNPSSSAPPSNDSRANTGKMVK